MATRLFRRCRPKSRTSPLAAFLHVNPVDVAPAFSQRTFGAISVRLQKMAQGGFAKDQKNLQEILPALAGLFGTDFRRIETQRERTIRSWLITIGCSKNIASRCSHRNSGHPSPSPTNASTSNGKKCGGLFDCPSPFRVRDISHGWNTDETQRGQRPQPKVA